MYSGNALNLHNEISGSILLLSRSVHRYDPVSGSVRELPMPTTFTSQPSAVRYSSERSFLYDSRRIYGVYYDSDTVDIVHEIPPGFRISNVSHSGNGLLWIATDGGIFYIDLSDGSSTPLKADLFLSSKTVAAKGSLVWIGTDNDIYLWDNDHKIFKDYKFPHGIYYNEFRPKATLVSQDGNIYMGGMDGLLVIDGTAPPATTLPRIALSDVAIDSKRCPGASMGDNLKVKWTAASVSIDIHAEGDDLFARGCSFSASTDETLSGSALLISPYGIFNLVNMP